MLNNDHRNINHDQTNITNEILQCVHDDGKELEKLHRSIGDYNGQDYLQTNVLGYK